MNFRKLKIYKIVSRVLYPLETLRIIYLILSKDIKIKSKIINKMFNKFLFYVKLDSYVINKKVDYNNLCCDMTDHKIVGEEYELLNKSDKEEDNLNPNWVTGYIDGEGAFMLNIYSDKSKSIGYTIRPIFQITVHESDLFILYKIKKFFNNIGSIKKVGLYFSYKVESLKEIDAFIIPHFNKYPLLSINKFKSFFLLRICINLIKINKKMNKDLFIEILKYKASFKKGLKAKVFDVYKDIVPFNFIDMPYSLPDKISPYWIAGFVAADGTFGVYQRGGKYKNYGCSFRISQDKVDELLLIHISEYLGCGVIIKSKTGMRDLAVFSLSELNEIIIPFFKKYKLYTSKKIDFDHFCQIVEIFNKKGNNKRWVIEDVEKIRLLTLKMNSFRRNKE